jgi:hypothetical protein
MKPKVALIPPPYLPVPAVKGGAVGNLVQTIVEENELLNKLNLEDRLISSIKELRLGSEIDYTEVNKRLQEYINQSKTFIQDCLK